MSVWITVMEKKIDKEKSIFILKYSYLFPFNFFNILTINFYIIRFWAKIKYDQSQYNETIRFKKAPYLTELWPFKSAAERRPVFKEVMLKGR